MVVVEPGPSALDAEILTLYFARDPKLGHLPVIVLHGPSTTTNSTLNTSRIQAHIFSIAGFQSYPRLTISPTSSLYSAVHCLPAEDQGDEISRGLAISLFKYFGEIPEAIRRCTRSTGSNSEGNSNPTAGFDATHAAALASQMERVENSAQIIGHLLSALSSKSRSWIDIDLILPKNSITKIDSSSGTSNFDHNTVFSQDGSIVSYGRYQEVVELFGAPSFIPTSKLKRAPSKPTGGSKSRFLSDEQRTSLELDLQEVLDTERNYVLKIQELATVVAPRIIATDDKEHSNCPADIVQLFPPSLHRIMDVNTRFLNFLEGHIIIANEGSVNDPDASRVAAFASALLDILPDFYEPYIDYIKASSIFFTILNGIVRDGGSRAAQEIQQVGEQRLRSWLIEPIQRLPRYILFVENMLKKLPIAHPAISKLLKAKDLIGQILDAQDFDVNSEARALKRLQSIVSDWPTVTIQGRLITAMDVAELKAPYAYNTRIRDEPQGVLLLFPDNVVILRKISGNAISARGLIAELDRSQAAHLQQPSLSFEHTFKLTETSFTDSNDGHCIHLASVMNSSLGSSDNKCDDKASVATRVYALVGSSEGKAVRWHEEVARARIENRFLEALREDYRWNLRTVHSEVASLGVVSAVFEDGLGEDVNQQRKTHGRVRVVICDDEHGNESNMNLNDVEILARIKLLDNSKYSLEIKGVQQHVFLDKIHTEDLLSVFWKQLSNLQRIQHQPTTTRMALIHVAFNQKIAETIRPSLHTQVETRSARFRPISPVKVLSSFLGGIRDQTSQNKLPALERSNSKQSFRSMKDLKPGLSLGFSDVFGAPKAMPVAEMTDNAVEGAFVQLEKTFNTYIVALHSRSGNVVGKVIRNRAYADEVMVNELYNVLLEDPSQYQATAEVSVDVLFAAFEKFLNRAWRAKIGSLLPTPILSKLEQMFNKQHFGQLETSFKALLHEMTPQNRRAFSAIIKLLYDLLDASGNDGDRGAITAAVSEALFQDVEYLKYIPLLDRMVDNIDILFEDVVISNDKPASQIDSVSRRVKATTPGSISSTTSSFKKRFGFGSLSRENSKNESESRVGQILRNLSKKTAGETTSQPSSLSKAFLNRSKSIDDETRRPFFSRPGSSASKAEPSVVSSRPTSSHQEPSDLVAPLARVEPKLSQLPKKKRRSSLSDITSLRDAPEPDFLAVGRSRPLPPPTKLSSPLQDARQALRSVAAVATEPRHKTPSPQRESASKIPSPVINRKVASPSPTRKENIPPTSFGGQISPKRMSTISNNPAGPRKRDLNSTQTPSLRPGSSNALAQSPHRSILSPPATASNRDEIGGTQNTKGTTPARRVLSGSPQRKTSATTQKLRMQSPQKLRERLEREKKAIQETLPSLGHELAKIGQELSSTSQSSMNMRNRLEALETRLNASVTDLMARNTAIHSDVETSLLVSEKKAKSLDEIYREANAENELLYDRFNTELMRVLDAVKTGTGVVEMKNKLKEAQDEASRLRKENQRLKRENLGLRSQLR